MSDYTPHQIEAVNRAITDHDYPQLTCFDHDGICCPRGEFHDKTREEWATHRAEAVLAAAGVAPQPEPEYEYSWEGADDEGDDWIMDEWFATVAGAERYADSRMGNWVRTDNGNLIRRVKAGAWEPAPVQSDGSAS